MFPMTLLMILCVPGAPSGELYPSAQRAALATHAPNVLPLPGTVLSEVKQCTRQNSSSRTLSSSMIF